MRKLKCIVKMLIGGMLILQSCQTVEFPEPSNTGQDTPQFLFDGTVNGEPINWAAGQNDYFMETTTKKDDQNVITFIGHLKEEGCTDNCPNSLKFIIRDAGATVSTAPVNINAVLSNGNLNLTSTKVEDSLAIIIKSKLPESFEHTLQVNEQILEDWQLDQRILVGSLQESVKLILSGEHKEGWMNYRLTQPVDLLEQNRKRIQVMMKANGRKLDIIMNVTPANDRTQIKWITGENSTVVEGNKLSLEEIPLGRIKGVVSYGEGLEAEFILNFSESFQLQNFQNESLNLGIDFEPVKVEHKNPKQFKTIEVQYFDDQGVQYSTINANQSNENYFQIQSSEEFINNDQGLKTRKIQFDMNVSVNRDGNSNILIDGSGAFAVAYP